VRQNPRVEPRLKRDAGLPDLGQYSGCAYYVFVDTSDVASPTTITP
jgi:hypothetical protein